MSRRTTILVVVSVLVLIVCMIGALVACVLLGDTVPIGKGKVAMIRVEGIITSGRSSAGIFGDGTAGAEHIIKLLERFRKDDSVDSLVLRINSPGGSAAGSQEIYQEIVRVRRDGKKVTVSMGDVAASGGYYIASAADRIYADPATLTGSIGVIMETTELYELFNKIGVDMVTIKSGKHKDIGSPARPMTPEERQILQSVINDVFDQFVTDVSKGRKLPKAKVLKLADGRIYTGRQAVNLGLVDRTGSLEDALRAAARDAGIKGEFSIVEYERPPSLLDLMVGPTDTSVPEWLRHRALLGEFARSLLRVGSDIHVN